MGTETSRARHMNLAVFLAGDSNYHHLGWRQPDAVVDAGSNFERWIAFAKIAEAAKLDMLFVADQIAIVGSEDMAAIVNSAKVNRLEPLMLLSALSGHTSEIGLAATCATSYAEPYTVARMFASLDQISDGRAAWNCVTGGQKEEAENFSLERHRDHAERYERANEFADVVIGLWNSFEADALLYDKTAGRFFDPEKIHVLNHKGKHFAVKGPLNVSRTPQGRPVIIQAGGSEATITMGGRIADVVFTAQADLEAAQEFRGQVRAAAARQGRTPNNVKVMPGLAVYVAPTLEEAQAKFDALHDMIDVADAIAGLGRLLGGVDLSGYDPDGPMPPLEGNDLRMSGPGTFVRIGREKNYTLGQVAVHSKAARNHGLVVGDAKDVADHMAHWFREGGADGFNLLPATVPGTLQDFCELVVPELQRRGLFRTEYEGRTLRERMGLQEYASAIRSPVDAV
jgi:FMN-dependent oxidoreductase (nitrilotriacetate monooxygenase family)